MSCPLCDCELSGPSWIGAVVYLGQKFPYVECGGCRSLYCDPMPGDEVVARMYGPDYVQGGGEGPGDAPAGPACESPKETARVLEWLRGREPGTFIDYGCRDGALLAEAARLGWCAVGVELDEAVAAETSARTGLPVVTPSDALLTDHVADAVHLGDVIEHLTKVNEQMPEVLRLVRPGGALLAQGPLEANASLFTAALRLWRSLRRARTVEMIPYHVMLATRAGQRRLFERFGLREVEFALSEVTWPAPDRCSLADLRRPRALGLFALRRCSQAASALSPRAWGNRYFYVGIKGA
jgi:SAM-dependent methyltransferase